MFVMRCVWMLFVVVFTAAAVQPLGKGSPSPHPSAAPALRPDAMLSRRALRNARLLIEMRMLELRDERLECVRRAILRRLPPELRPPSANERGDPLRSESEDCAWKSTPPERPERTD